jgi:alkylation response protein AidB-like acyl-CoA dehydrogenase
VHTGLAAGSIYLCGDEEQKHRWLPAMMCFEKIGSFGLTEPLVGSATSGGMTTTCQRDGDTWVLNGEKKWIGNATFADLNIIWARDESSNQVKGFVVGKDNPGFSVKKIERKTACGAEWSHHIEGLSGGRSGPAAKRQQFQRYRKGAEDDACWSSVVRSRLRARRL